MSRSFQAIVARLETWVQRHYVVFLCFVLGILALNEIWLFGLDLSQWDLLLISGAITFVVGLHFALRIPQKVDVALTRLVNRGVLQLTPETLANLKQDLSARAARWAHRGGVSVTIVVLLAFLIAFGPDIIQHLDLTLVEMLGGYIVGRYLGRMACYGQLGWLLRQRNIPLNVQPGHLDGAAGFKPVGDLYFFQAMVIAIPALYLAVWWFLIPAFDQYAQWREPYLGLLAVVLTVEVLAFLIPVWSFHQEMLDQKTRLLDEADRLSRAVDSGQAELTEAKTGQERSELKDRLAQMTERYSAIEQMPTWPVDPRVRRRFTFNNLALFLPLISRSFQVTGAWQKVLEELQQILKNIST
jgi:hypothetical protein